MAWEPTVLSIPPLVAAVFSVVLVYDVWDHRDDPLGRPFLAMMAVIAAWSLSYAVQLGYTTLAEQMVWQKIGVFFGAIVPVLWIVVTSRYAGRDGWLTDRRLTVLAAEPVAVGVIATLNPDDVFWATLQFGPEQVAVDPGIGPVYAVHVLFGYGLVLVGIGLLVSVFVRASAYRLQAALLATGAIVPLTANAAFLAGFNPVPGLDLTTSTFTVTGVVFGLALFRFDLLNLQPVARNQVIDDLGNGLIIVDDEGTIVDTNPTARQVVPGATAGRPALEVLPGEELSDCHREVLQTDGEGGRQYYECQVSQLTDYRGRNVGQVVALREVTDRQAYQQRLEVANRLLRHNLRNDMTKILGWTGVILDEADGGLREAAEQVEAVAENVADLGQKAKRIEESLEAGEEDLTTVDATDALETALEEIDAEFPHAELAFELPESAPVCVPSEELLETALWNVLENAVEHNDREEPSVEVNVTRTAGDGTPGWTTVAVADDGPGIPEMERETLLEGEETALAHGSGLGLWLVNWIVEASGGRLEFRENEPRGSVVALQFQPDARR